MVILDANVILRYLLNDNQSMAEEAEKHIEEGSASVTAEVIAEVVYVLHGVYSLERNIISETIKGFLSLVVCSDKESLILALNTYAEHNLDFVDCLLFAYHAVKGVEIVTFDRKLKNLIDEYDAE